MRNDHDHDWVSQYLPAISPFWFRGDDIGEKINRAFAAAGKGGVVALNAFRGDWHDGEWDMLRTGIVIDRANSEGGTLRGINHRGTTLCIASEGPEIGIDAFKADEFLIRDIRVHAQRGDASKRKICYDFGGTDLLCERIWAGNAAVGIRMAGGIGCIANNVYIEYCGVGLDVAQFGPWSRREHAFSNIELHGCKDIGFRLTNPPDPKYGPRPITIDKAFIKKTAPGGKNFEFTKATAIIHGLLSTHDTDVRASTIVDSVVTFLGGYIHSPIEIVRSRVVFNGTLTSGEFYTADDASTVQCIGCQDAN